MTDTSRRQPPGEPMVPVGDKVIPLSTLVKGVHGSGSWFHWIAGLSIVNSAVILFNGEWGMVIGLGITQVFDAIGQSLAEGAGGSSALAIKAMALVPTVLIAGFFFFLGFHAKKGRVWAFLIGMAGYTIDGLLFILVGDWLSVGFHAFVLIMLFTGLTAAMKLRSFLKTQRAIAAAGASADDPPAPIVP